MLLGEFSRIVFRFSVGCFVARNSPLFWVNKASMVLLTRIVVLLFGVVYIVSVNWIKRARVEKDGLVKE